MYLEFFHCASFKKKIIKIRSVELEIQGGHKHTHRQTDNSGELDHPLEKQTRSLATRVKSGLAESRLKE